MDKIKEFFNNITREQWVFIGIFSAILLSSVVWIWWTSRDDAQEAIIEDGGVEQSLSFQVGYSVDIPRSIERKDAEQPGSLPIYPLINSNRSSRVQEVISLMGLSSLQRRVFQDQVYVWAPRDESILQTVSYNSIDQKLAFSFDEPVELSTVSTSEFNTGAPEEYFERVISEILGYEVTYLEFNVTQEARRYKIEGSRDFGGYPLQIAGMGEYSDEMWITSDGLLVSGRILMYELEGSAIDIPLLTPAELSTVVSRDDYPKTFNQGEPVGFDLTDYGVEEFDPTTDNDVDFRGDFPFIEALDIPEADSCEGTNIRLVYYYASSDVDAITPVYRIECRGQILYRGDTFDVPVVVYANALSPEYVSVPSEIEILDLDLNE